jgi:uncharacterized cupredoxin-like copper-binding protein
MLPPHQIEEDGVPEEPQSSNVDLMPTFLGVAIALLIVATILIIGLARRHTGVSLPRGYNVVHVTEFTYGIQLANTTIPAGNTLFIDKNTGSIPHEFVLFKTDRPAADLPLAADGTADEDSPLLEDDADSGSALAPGETRLLTADLEPGHYALVCNLPPNHYKAGMRIDVTVK